VKSQAKASDSWLAHAPLPLRSMPAARTGASHRVPALQDISPSAVARLGGPSHDAVSRPVTFSYLQLLSWSHLPARKVLTSGCRAAPGGPVSSRIVFVEVTYTMPFWPGAEVGADQVRPSSSEVEYSMKPSCPSVLRSASTKRMVRFDFILSNAGPGVQH
jgi:hypothetical protein